MGYAVVIIAVLLIALILAWKGSDIGFYTITVLMMVFGMLLLTLVCGWLYYSFGGVLPAFG
jgi:hypothetical protein